MTNTYIYAYLSPFFIIGIASGLYSLLVKKNVIFSCLNYFDCKSEHLFFFAPDTSFHGILEFQHDKKQTCNMHGAYLNYSEIMGRVHKQLA